MLLRSLQSKGLANSMRQEFAQATDLILQTHPVTKYQYLIIIRIFFNDHLTRNRLVITLKNHNVILYSFNYDTPTPLNDRAERGLVLT